MRRASLLGLLLIGGLIVGVAACGDDPKPPDRSSSVNTDLSALERMIKLPAHVKSAQWQTGKRGAHGGDWWLAAVLDVAADQMPAFLPGAGRQELFETPSGLELNGSFAALRSLPGAQLTDTQRVRLVTETYPIEPYASSPLLNGKAIRLSSTQVLVVLWTQ